VAKPGWRLRGRDVNLLVPVEAVGRDGEGHRYTYRVRSLRAMLWYAGVFVLAPILADLLRVWLGVAVSVPSGWVTYTLVAGAMWLWGLWRYFAAKVETDADGITVYGAFGNSRLRWEQVENYKKVGEGGKSPLVFLCLEGAGRKLWVHTAIGCVEELMGEIAKRVPGVPKTGWNKKDT